MNEFREVAVTPHKIKDVEVHLVSTQAAAGLSDATRKVERVGMTVVRVRRLPLWR